MWNENEKFQFCDLVAALNQYREGCQSNLKKFSEGGYRTPEEIAEIRQAINLNSDLFEYMAKKAPFSFGGTEPISIFPTRNDKFDDSDLHQLSAALKSAARDWTAMGELERKQTYTPIVSALKEFLPNNSKILIPGAGLCRLATEIASSGYIAFANENSFIMILMSQIAFRHKKQFRIFPFLHQISGLESFKDTLISDIFPRFQTRDPDLDADGDPIFDINYYIEDENDNTGKSASIFEPNVLIQNRRLIPLAGDVFGLQGSQPNFFDGIVTCFFIDVVKDIEEVVSLFFKLLKPGGYWINMGPLVMHKADDDFFAKYTFADIPKVAQKCGFKIIRESRIDTSYIPNPNTNIKLTYRCQFLVVQK